MARAKPTFHYGQNLQTDPVVPEPVVPTPEERPDPFDGAGISVPEANQEIAIMVFPVITFKQISDEAAKRGITFAQATKEAYDDWMAKPYRRK